MICKSVGGSVGLVESVMSNRDFVRYVENRLIASISFREFSRFDSIRNICQLPQELGCVDSYNRLRGFWDVRFSTAEQVVITMTHKIDVQRLNKAICHAGEHMGYYIRPCHRTRNEPGLQYYIGESAERWYTAWGEGDDQLAEFEDAVAPDLVINIDTELVPSTVRCSREIWHVLQASWSEPVQMNMFDCRSGKNDPVAITESSVLPGLSSDVLQELTKDKKCERLGIQWGSPPIKHPESNLRSEDVQEVIRHGPVLSLDIDGVLAPVWGVRSPFPETPPGFVRGAQDAEAHQAMNGWLERLSSVFPTIVWNSSWGHMARGFAESTGLDCAIGWPSIYLSAWNLQQGDILEPPHHHKIYGLMTKVDPNVPLAVLDDDHIGGRLHTQVGECLLSRPGPTLIVAPNPLTGIGTALVEKLEAWAREPYHNRCIMGMYGTGKNLNCFWRHGNCDDPYGYGQEGMGWIEREREGGRPDEQRLTHWREGWWDKIVP